MSNSLLSSSPSPWTFPPPLTSPPSSRNATPVTLPVLHCHVRMLQALLDPSRTSPTSPEFSPAFLVRLRSFSPLQVGSGSTGNRRTWRHGHVRPPLAAGYLSPPRPVCLHHRAPLPPLLLPDPSPELRELSPLPMAATAAVGSGPNWSSSTPPSLPRPGQPNPTTTTEPSPLLFLPGNGPGVEAELTGAAAARTLLAVLPQASPAAPSASPHSGAPRRTCRCQRPCRRWPESPE